MAGHTRFYINASWEARAETPDELAVRFLRLIDSLKQIDPIFNLWTCGARGPKKFEAMRDRYAEEIAASVTTDDWGEPEPFDGYWFGAITRDTPKSRSFAILCHAGSIVERPFTNYISFKTSSLASPDPNSITYRLFRSVLLAIVAACNPVRGAAYSNELAQIDDGTSYFPPAWIEYLCPLLARQIMPPTSAIVEHLPDGGLLMSATTETFKADNPAHLAVARDMAVAMAPLDDLSWPSENRPR